MGGTIWDDDELSELLEEVDVEDYLSIEGVDFKITTGSSGVQANIKECPRCGGTDWKVYLNVDTGLGNCFHGSCQGEPGFNKFSFIRSLLGNASVRALKDHLRQYAMDAGWRPKRKIAMETTNVGEIELPSSLALPTKDGQNLDYLKGRGFSDEITAFFGWRYCHEGGFAYQRDGERRWQKYDQRVILPVWDVDGDLVTFQGRDITGKAQRKYLFPPGLPGTSRFLYNGQSAVRASRIVIAEGALDVAAVKMALDDEVSLRDVIPVGTFGKNLSANTVDGKDQLSALFHLKRHGLKEVTFMWDGETSAIDAACKAATLVKSIGIEARVGLLPKGKDPNEVIGSVIVDTYYKALPVTPSGLNRLRMEIRRR